MKNYYFKFIISILIVINFSLVSFSQTLSVSKTSLTLPAMATNSISFYIASTTDWYILSSNDWLSVNTAYGSFDATITILAQKNTSSATRSATITVVGTTATQTIAITQDGADIYSQTAVAWGTWSTGEDPTLDLPFQVSQNLKIDSIVFKCAGSYSKFNLSYFNNYNLLGQQSIAI